MSEVKRFIWGITLGDEEEFHSFESKEQILSFLKNVAGQHSGCLTVSKIIKVEKSNWWKRFIGYSRSYQSLIWLQLYWYEEYARLIFSDQNSSEYCVYNRANSMVPDEVRSVLSAGEPTPAPADECIDKQIAFRAAYESIEHDARLDWLQYRYVK